MADQAALINQVRRLVRDWADGVADDQTYVDAFYTDALDHGLGIVNFDFDQAWTVSSIAANRLFLLRLQAAIYMCGIRGGEGATTDDSDTAAINSITVPDLTIGEGTSADTDQGTKFWATLAAGFQAQYDTALKQFGGGDAGGERVVTQSSFTAISRATGRERDRKMARPITHDLGSAYSSDDLDITVTWDVLYDTLFSSYEVLVADTEAKLIANTPDRRFTLSDNHDDSKTFTATAAGTWYVRVDILSVSDLRTKGDVLTIEVP